MNIAIVTNLFPPIQTGSSYWTKELALNLLKKGHKVIVMTCLFSGENVESEKNLDDILIYRLPSTLNLPKTKLFLNFKQFYLMWSKTNEKKMEKILSDNKIDVIHQCGHLLDSAFLTKRVAKKLRIPTICSVHTRIYNPYNIFFDRVLKFFDRNLWGKLVINKFDAMISLDKEIADYVKSIYTPEIHEIAPVCVDESILKEKAATPEAGGEFLKITSVGHATEMRNRIGLLKAIKILLDDDYNVRLTVIGKVLSDKFVNGIKKLCIESYVDVLGEVPRENLFDLLRKSNVEAHWIDMPSIGSASMEAMAIGLPVMCNAYEGIYGESIPLKNWENIVLIDPNSPEDIAMALKKLAENPELRKKIGRNSRQFVKEYLAWGYVVDKIIDVYETALQKNRNRDYVC